MFRNLIPVGVVVTLAIFGGGNNDDSDLLHRRGPASPSIIRDNYGIHTSTTLPPQTIHGWINDGALRSGNGLRGHGEGRCPQFEQVALEAGWTQQQWPTVSRLMYAESLCLPTARNPRNNGPYGHARGLMQIMDLLWPRECGITMDQLYDPLLNLQCALLIYHEQGWKAWATF